MLKVNLKSPVKPRVFWLSIIILLIGSTTLFILKEKERTLRIHAQKQLTKSIEEKKVIKNKLIETTKAKEEVELELVAEKERTLVMEKELKEKERQIKFALDKLEREIAARRKAEDRLLIVVKEKEILEAKIKRFDKVPKTVELEKIVVKPASILVGEVIAVNKEYAFIIIDLGKKDNLKSGEVLSVYRNDEFIGKVRIERVEEKMSAAVILPDWQNVEFKESDVVKTI